MCGFATAACGGGWRRKAWQPRYFDFSYIDFGKINFSGDTTARTLNFKINVKHADKARFRLRNDEKDEPFGIYDLALEFTQGANVR